jgi:hypothetical protein
MAWRVLLTAFYGVAFGALLAWENFEPEISNVPLFVLSVAAPVVGFVVGRWWVVLAVLGALVGRVIGWDSAENDGNPALWPPYVAATLVYLAVPLLIGAACSSAWRSRRQCAGAKGPELRRG